jgi:hypothetical protein
MAPRLLKASFDALYIKYVSYDWLEFQPHKGDAYFCKLKKKEIVWRGRGEERERKKESEMC